MLLLEDTQVDRIARQRRTAFLGGLGLLALAFLLPQESKFGAISGFMLLSLGIYGTAFRNWRTEPGLWMLALFLTVLFGTMLAVIEYNALKALLAPPDHPIRNVTTWSKIRLSIDGSIALLLWGRIVKLAATVARRNWQLTRSFETEP